MSHCVKLYFENEHHVTLPDNAITMVPLEGEGKIEDRVELLYQKLIENPLWLEAVSSADVILWATHSQGTPVSTILLQRLLERGHIHTFRQSVCMLAMAGISHGPFPSLRESLLVKYFEADAARELFEFMDSNSTISVKFRQSLSYILKCGTRVVLTGSMKDQVVPLYSAIMTATQHPNILRQLYIDEHLYSEKDFLVNLVVLLVKIRNRGHSDHHLLTYLSEILAGSLYAIEGGHSTIYEDLGVYMTAVRYTFETGPFGRYMRVNDHAEQRRWWSHQEDPTLEEFQAQQTFNPFYLPWALQGVCTDPDILKDDELRRELRHLVQLFDEWKPTSAKLKELKFKLEPFKSTRLV
ncbi:hypothetical protein K501DRAFT_295888 [Backusella circina FSU 941]|nr:hypothetical protein K501DRAFT_295888 [Backusella circina FSU 941]